MLDDLSPRASTDVPVALRTPTASLHGPIDEDMLACWIEPFAKACSGSGPLVVELSTTGGDAEIGRRIADDVRLFRDQTGRQALFLGKTMIYQPAPPSWAAF